MKHWCSWSSIYWPLITSSASVALAQPRTMFQDSSGPCPRDRCALVSASWCKSGGSCFFSLAWTGLDLVSCVQNAPWNLSSGWFQCPWPAFVMRTQGWFVVAWHVLSIGFPFEMSVFSWVGLKVSHFMLVAPPLPALYGVLKGPEYAVAECETKELYSPKYLSQRTVYFTGSTDVSTNLNQKHPHRHIYK